MTEGQKVFYRFSLTKGYTDDDTAFVSMSIWKAMKETPQGYWCTLDGNNGWYFHPECRWPSGFRARMRAIHAKWIPKEPYKKAWAYEDKARAWESFRRRCFCRWGHARRAYHLALAGKNVAAAHKDQPSWDEKVWRDGWNVSDLMGLPERQEEFERYSGSV